jgi:hypothetical protein
MDCDLLQCITQGVTDKPSSRNASPERNLQRTTEPYLAVMRCFRRAESYSPLQSTTSHGIIFIPTWIGWVTPARW